MIYCAIAAAFSVLIFFGLGLIIDNILWRILPVPVIVIGAFFFVRKDPRTNKSILDDLLDRRAYYKNVNRFYYIYGSGRGRDA